MNFRSQQNRAASPDSYMVAKANPDGSGVVHYGVGDRNVTPISVHFDANGRPSTIEVPNQNRSGSAFIPADANPKLLGAIETNAGRYGGDFIARVSNQTAGTRYTADHYDRSQAMLSRSTDAQTVIRNVADASSHIVGASQGASPLPPSQFTHPANSPVHQPHIARPGAAAGRAFGVGLGTVIAGVVGAGTAGASELVNGNGVSAALNAAGRAGTEAALDATPGVNVAKSVSEGRDREANVRSWESMPLIGWLYGEIRRPMERLLNGAGDNAPENRRVDPGFIESGITTAAGAVGAAGSAIINRFSRPSTPVAADTMAGFTPPTADTPTPQQTAATTPSAPAALNTPRDPNMQQALVQAQQSGAAQGAQATNMQAAQQSASKAPPPVPDQAHGTGHSFGLSA